MNTFHETFLLDAMFVIRSRDGFRAHEMMWQHASVLISGQTHWQHLCLGAMLKFRCVSNDVVFAVISPSSAGAVRMKSQLVRQTSRLRRIFETVTAQLVFQHCFCLQVSGGTKTTK